MLNKEFVILGCGRFGSTVIECLNNAGVNVVAIDKDKETIERVGKKCSYAVCADTTDMDVLKDLHISKAKCIILCLGDVEDSITTCANLVELGAQGIIIAQAINKLHARVLKILGVKYVSLPIQEVAELVALRALYSFGENVYSLTNGLSWTKVVVQNPKCTKQKIRDLGLRSSHRTNILYLVHNNHLKFPVDPDSYLSIGDTIAIMCPYKDMNGVINYFSGKTDKEK